MNIAILVAVYAILIVLLLIAAVLVVLVWFVWKNEQRLAEMQRSAVDIEKPMDMLKKMAESVETFERILKGQLNIAQEQVKATLGLESAVTAFTRLNFGIDKPGADHFGDIADNDEVTRIMNEGGISRSEAEIELKRQRAYSAFSLEG